MVALATLVACSAPVPPPRPAQPPPDLAPRIEAALARPGQPLPGEALYEREALGRFYAARAYRPAWLSPAGVAAAPFVQLRRGVEAAALHGLRPESYRAALLARLSSRPLPADAGQLAALDLLLSDAFLRLARHLSTGAVDPGALHPGFERSGPAPPDPATALAAALAAGDVAETLARLAPPHPEYAALVRALARQRAAAALGDPAAGPQIDRLRANLERWRWLPRELGRRHLRVELPDFDLRAFEAGRVVLAMRVVVGDVGWQTPLVQGLITHLVLNPSWVVPRSIATREMLPAVRRDPEYLANQGIQVLVNAHGTLREVDASRIDWSAIRVEDFPFWLRQPPGPHNPLGSIKFMFANAYDVYLHGTPSDAAFGRPMRTLSHGCVRVEDEIALASFALAPDPDWSEARLVETLRDALEQRVRLPAPLPVYLVYFTASADAQGDASFHHDPYGWDPVLIDALDAASAEDAALGVELRDDSTPH